MLKIKTKKSSVAITLRLRSNLCSIDWTIKGLDKNKLQITPSFSAVNQKYLRENHNI